MMRRTYLSLLCHHRLLAPILALADALAGTTPALAHATGPVTPDTWLSAWNLELPILLPLWLLGWLYARGAAALCRQTGSDRAVPPVRRAYFAGGMLALIIALVSPLDHLSGTLFIAHMAQHLLLILVAAPLLVLSQPVAPLLWGVPRDWRPNLARFLVRPAGRLATSGVAGLAFIWAIHAAAVWVWHAPALYEAALNSPWAHAAEHASFFGTAVLFWWCVSRAGPRRSVGLGTAALAVFTMGAVGGGLGALLTFAPAPLYPSHAAATLWGLTQLEDQQFAGLVMWVPASMVYLLAGLALIAAWLQSYDRRVARRPAPVSPAPTREPA